MYDILHLFCTISCSIKGTNKSANTCSRYFNWYYSDFFKLFDNPYMCESSSSTPTKYERKYFFVHNNILCIHSTYFWQKATHPYHHCVLKIHRKIILVLWMSLVASFGIYVFFHREFLDPKYLLLVFRSVGTWAIIAYIFVSMFRSIILLPSLPLVVVGILYAPSMPHIVFIISMLGIWFSWTLVYYFSHILWLDDIFQDHMHDPKIKESIEKYGAYIISFWSFFPILPVDVACYLAGTVRIKYWKFILALTIWEGTVVAIIIYGWKEIMNLLGF